MCMADRYHSDLISMVVSFTDRPCYSLLFHPYQLQVWDDNFQRQVGSFFSGVWKPFFVYPGEVQAEHELYGVVFAGRSVVSMRLDISCARYLKDTALCINKWSIKSLGRFEQVIKIPLGNSCIKSRGLSSKNRFFYIGVSLCGWASLGRVVIL